MMTLKEKDAQLKTLNAAYIKALFAKDEARCLQLAEDMVLLTQGTPLEAQQRRVLARHTKTGPSQLRQDLGLA